MLPLQVETVVVRGNSLNLLRDRDTRYLVLIFGAIQVRCLRRSATTAAPIRIIKFPNLK